MNKKILILGIFFSTLILSSCVKDLNTAPIDPNSNIDNTLLLQQGFLGKIYASFIINGQGGSQSYNGADITSSDNDFFTTTRALWNCQEITTDEAICAWGDPGIADLNTQTWSPKNPFLTALYQRLALSITYANGFIGQFKERTDGDFPRYVAEARFLRALAYSYAIDLFGKFPFVTEADGIGNFYPKIGTRTQLFNFAVSELHAISSDLGEPKFQYPEADKASAWMLLARLYLNAQVYTGTAKWDSCKLYCDSVINSGKYHLADNYRQNFSADNDGLHNPEMIFAFEQDGKYTQGYVGSTFIIESSSDSRYIDATKYHGLTSNTDWNGNRTKSSFIASFMDTATVYAYNGGNFDPQDTMFAKCPDKRAYFKTKKQWDIPSPSSGGDYGIGVMKFTARNTDGSQATNYNAAYACTDFPIFRYADALLMHAEAAYHLGDKATSVSDINQIRKRAYGDDSGNIDESALDDPLFILWERGREFYYEAQRRTDLVRFGVFTGGTYLWQWKGNTHNGTATDSHLNIFPIPGDEISANPNYNGLNNPGY
jgi:SusD family.